MKNDKEKQFINKKAFFNYKILDTLETGVILEGLEIKAIRAGRIDITGSYVKIISEEVFWIGGNFNIEGDKQRTKKLLLNKKEIHKLIGLSSEKKYSLVPLKLYLKRGKAKLQIGWGSSMKKYDKRELIKRREQEIEVGRAVRTKKFTS